MGILTSLIFSAPQATYQPWDQFWYQPLAGTQTQSGAYVGPDSGLCVSAVFQGIRLISETLAKVPCITYERVDEDSRRRATENKLYPLLHNRPNSYQTSYEYRVLAQSQVMLRGNHYSQIIPTPTGDIAELVPLHPDRMKLKKLPQPGGSYRIGYLYRDVDGIQFALTQDEVFHVRGPMLSCDDLCGVTPMTYARETVGGAITMQNYSDALFRQGAMHRGNFSVPGGLNAEQRKQMKDMIRTETAGPSGWHSSLVLENGATWVQTGMSAVDAEFILSRKFGVIEIARWLNIQPHLLRDLDKSSYSNHEQESLEFAQITMLPHFVNWEQVISKDLILRPEKFFVEFLLDAVVRADIQARFNAYGVGIDKGFMTPNEVRQKENLNRLEGLDRPRIAQNIAMIDENGKVLPANNPQQQGGREERRRREDQPPPGQNGARRAALDYYDRVLSALANQVNGVEIKALRGIFSQFSDESKVKDEGLKFYDRFGSKLSKFLCISRDISDEFAAQQAKRFLNAVETGGQDEIVTDLESHGQERLLAFVMEDQGFEKKESDKYKELIRTNGNVEMGHV